MEWAYSPPGERPLVRDQHTLEVHDGRDRDGAPLGCTLDDRPLSRAAAAWVLSRWLKGRRQGGALWCTRYGGLSGEPAPARGSVLWTPRYGDDGDVTSKREEASER